MSVRPGDQVAWQLLGNDLPRLLTRTWLWVTLRQLVHRDSPTKLLTELGDRRFHSNGEPAATIFAMSAKPHRRRRLLAALATSGICGASVTAGFTQAPSPAQVALLMVAMVFSGLLGFSEGTSGAWDSEGKKKCPLRPPLTSDKW